jgi:hypothetical protein
MAKSSGWRGGEREGRGEGERGRTYAHQQEKDAEDVDDGEQGEGERGDDLAEGGDAAEEADDAEGAEDADDAGVEVLEKEGDYGHGDDEGVHLAPHVGKEGLEPVGEDIDPQLDGEDDGEDEVQLVHEFGQLAGRPVGVGHSVQELRLENGAGEILQHAGRGQGKVAQKSWSELLTAAISTAITLWNSCDSYRCRTLNWIFRKSVLASALARALTAFLDHSPMSSSNSSCDCVEK